MRRKFLLTMLFVLTAAPAVGADLVVAGRGGNDKAIFHALLTDILHDELNDLGVNVEYLPVEANYNQFILNSLSSGTAPDIFYIEASMIEVVANSGRLHVYPEAMVSAADLVPILRESFTVNGATYALPKDFNSYALLYNKDIFDDANVDYPNADDDFDDFRSKLERIVAALSQEGVTGLCMNAGYSTGFAPFVLGTGWQPIDDQGRTQLDKRFRRGFQFFVDLLRDDLATMSIDLGHTWSGGCFGAERTAVAIEGNWVSRYLRDKAPNLLFGAVAPPSDPVSGESGNLIFSVGWGISQDTAEPRVAEQVVRLLTSSKAQQWILESGLALPSSESVLQNLVADAEASDSDTLLSRAIYDGAKLTYATAFSFGPYGDSWMDPINEALGSVLVGGMAVDEAIDKAQRRYDDLYSTRWEPQK